MSAGMTENSPLSGESAARVELRDALAGLFAEGNQAGAEEAAEVFISDRKLEGKVLDARFRIAEHGREFFVEAWDEHEFDPQDDDWPALTRVLAAIAALNPTASPIPEKGLSVKVGGSPTEDER